MTDLDCSDILDSLLCGIIITDTRFKVIYLNHSAEEIVEKSASQVLGQHLLSFMSYPELEEHLQQTLLGKHPQINREIRLNIRNREDIRLDLSITPKTRADEIIGILLELRPLERQMRIARDNHLLDTLNTNQTILRGVAHEIKNPLGGLSGAAQLLELESDDPTILEYTAIIRSETQRLTALIDSVLGPAKPPLKTLINVHEALEHCRQVISLKLPPHTTICSDYDPSIPELTADRDKLVQVILNIMINAQNALEESGGTILLKTRILRRFTINQLQHPLVCCISVIDDGPGLPAHLKDKIFYPMISGKAEGTGLGLSIAQTLITQHGGIIEVDSKPGHTIFSIILPLDCDHD